MLCLAFSYRGANRLSRREIVSTSVQQTLTVLSLVNRTPSATDGRFTIYHDGLSSAPVYTCCALTSDSKTHTVKQKEEMLILLLLAIQCLIIVPGFLQPVLSTLFWRFVLCFTLAHIADFSHFPQYFLIPRN